ncbi:hypothetical protein [Streptomyces sp. NPDC049949]|uniref:hypothetical protein n=1 Tax=Streptomyces sp. NPDC049949 TaxID=3154627 RepID=UPI003421700E
MTSVEGTPATSGSKGPQLRAPLLKWFTALTALAAVIATVVLATAGNAEAATAVAAIGAAALGFGGVQITVHIRR